MTSSTPRCRRTLLKTIESLQNFAFRNQLRQESSGGQQSHPFPAFSTGTQDPPTMQRKISAGSARAQQLLHISHAQAGTLKNFSPAADAGQRTYTISTTRICIPETAATSGAPNPSNAFRCFGPHTHTHTYTHTHTPPGTAERPPAVAPNEFLFTTVASPGAVGQKTQSVQEYSSSLLIR